jgi:uncharacterized protein (DUF488 family)
MANPFFTIGHSTRPIAEFAGLVQPAGVELVVDVRTVPRSRTNPQYNSDVLAGALAPFGVGYKHIAALGGLRGKTAGVTPDVNAFWTNQSFHNYADYATTEAFRSGLAQLRMLGRERRCVIMCAETLWWRCHRRIIADYLIAAGEQVFHILKANDVRPAVLNSAARPGPRGTLVYPAAA